MQLDRKLSGNLTHRPTTLHNENLCRVRPELWQLRFYSVIANHVASRIVSCAALKGEKITAAAAAAGPQSRGTAFFLSAVPPLFAISKAVRDVRVIADYARASITPGNSSSAGLRRFLPRAQASGVQRHLSRTLNNLPCLADLVYH